MSKITTMVFVLNPDAALAVARQLATTTAALQSGHVRSASASDIATHLDARLRTNTPFDITLHPSNDESVRAIWHPIATGSGLLYLAKNQALSTINLILSGQSAAPDQAAITRAAEILSPIGPYMACLNHITTAPRPLVAIFTSHDGQLSNAIELTTILFAGVFFHHHPCPTKAPQVIHA